MIKIAAKPSSEKGRRAAIEPATERLNFFLSNFICISAQTYAVH